MQASPIEVLPRGARLDLRAELRASQVGRLVCAVADCVAAKGYASTSVADIIAAAGVSRKTFYEHFADKEACFLAAYEMVADHIRSSMQAAAGAIKRVTSHTSSISIFAPVAKMGSFKVRISSAKLTFFR